MSSQQLTLTGFMTMVAGTQAMLLQEIDALVAATRAEPGCINYDFHQSQDDPTRFVFYENFVDQDAFNFHLAQPHTKAWIVAAEAQGATFDMQRWTMLSKTVHSN